MQYKYNGKITINLKGYGKVEPSQVIDTNEAINHPLFKKVTKKTKK